MKKLTTLIFLLLAINCYSQITIIATKEKEEPKEVQKYDSLESLYYENAPLHVGQTLYLRGNGYAKENGYFLTFFSKLVPDNAINEEQYTYKPTPGKRENEIVSSYSELVGKYYKVLSIETEKPSVGDTLYWLKLVGDDNSPFYFRIRKSYGVEGFITLGYYEKMKQTFVGKEFYSQGAFTRQKVDSEETVKPPLKAKFKCTDIAVKEGKDEDEPIFAVLENEQYGKIKGEIIEGKNLLDFVSISVYNEYIKKYGAKFGVHVANSRVEIGMNKKFDSFLPG